MTDDEEAGWAKITFDQGVQSLVEHGPSMAIGIGRAPLPRRGVRTFLAQIDTGASKSAIRPGLAQELGLEEIGKAFIGAAGSGASEHPLFAASFLFPKVGGNIDLNVVDLGTIHPPHDALIGRDILEQCRVFVDFTRGIWVLHINVPPVDRP